MRRWLPASVLLVFLIAPTASAIQLDADHLLELEVPELDPLSATDVLGSLETGPIWAPSPSLTPLAIGADPLANGAETTTPTSLGQAIIGFKAGMLPALSPGDVIGPVEIRKVEPRGDYLVASAATLEEAAAIWGNVPGVAYIEDDAIMTALAVPNDSRYGDQYGPAQMGAHAAWDVVGYGSSDIVVAVLDTGIRASHEDLAANYIGGYDYVNNDNNPNDDCGHGTHVSGTVAAVTNNGKGVAGVSQASIIHHKVLGPTGGFLSLQCSGSSSDINQAIYDAADDGADIISMSLGGGGYSNAGNNAVNYAWNAGALVVAAAGNDGQCNNCVGYPSAYANAISVASLTSSGAQSSFSSSGPEVEISAGGSSVWSTYNGNDADYDSLSGTSMATPHVAGALALALSCDPNLSNSQLRSLMQQTAQDLGPSGRDDDFGYGLLRVDNIVNQLSCGGNPPPNQDPTASFTFSTNDLTASFNGAGSSDPDGSIASYSWTFGDGATGSGASPSHTYVADGTFTVTLTVTDDDGATDSTSQSVTVSDGSSGGGGDTCTGGDAAATTIENGATSVSVSSGSYDHFKICVGTDATTFSAALSGPACSLFGCSVDADIYTREGGLATSGNNDCSDAAQGNTDSCSHSNPDAGWWYIGVYGYSGSGTVTLTVNEDGTHGPPPPPPANEAPTASFADSCNELACSFTDTSSDSDGSIVARSWTFGDGASSNAANPSHTYAADGTYTVTLTVTDDDGATDSTSRSITVATAPPPPPSGCSDNGDGVQVLEAGSSYDLSLSSGDFAVAKICSDGDSVTAAMTGPGCGLLGCNFDADLHGRADAPPTTSTYDCRPYQTGNSESCTGSASQWYYIGVHAYTGSGTVTLTIS